MARIDDIIISEQKRLESVLRAAYEAGEEASRSHILGILSGETAKSGVAANSAAVNADRKRAPRGLPRKLVLRVLMDNASFGSTPQSIVDAAITDDEKMIALSTVRSELRKGLAEGLYVERDGHWYSGRSADFGTEDPD